MPDHGHEDWTIVHAASGRRACEDQALVLEALAVPYLIADGPRGAALLMVPAAHAARARRELALYAAENRRRPALAALAPEGHGLPGVVAYAVVLLGVFLFQARVAWGIDWIAAGGLDGAAVRAGEWWRLFTALTLHGDAGHLVANLAFGAFFGVFAGQYLGSGVAWLVVLVAAGAGNGLDLLLLPVTHRAIGASTAVFAALGLIAALMWRSEARRTSGWARRYAPLIGASVLLAYIGTGDARTDAVAHLTGFVMGIFAGAAFELRQPHWLRRPGLQAGAGTAALALLAACWWLALGAWRAGLAA
jgi:membrane associated rhomboid family serine protease